MEETIIGGYYRLVREGDQIAVYKFKDLVRRFNTLTEAVNWASVEHEQDYWDALSDMHEADD